MPELYDYQKKALTFCLQKRRCYLALDMGMGKTCISLKWCKHILPSVKGILVIAPLRTIHSTWPDEIEKWSPELSYVILHGPKKDQELHKTADLYLMNYEGIAWLFDSLKRLFKTKGSLPFRGVILDEGSMIKSPSTKRFKILRRLKDIFPNARMILSGTPAPNSLLDLWSQYFFLDDGQRLGGAYTRYKHDHFQQVDRMGFVWKLRPGQDKPIYQKIQDITYRLDAKDYLELPERIDNIITVNLPEEKMRQYKELEKEFFLELEDTKFEAFSAASLSMKLRQFLQGAVYVDDKRNYKIIHKEKLNALKSLVEEADGQGILCAIQFRFELDMIRKMFPKAPVIAGGTNTKDAAKYIKQWNLGEIPLLLCHPASLSHGVNLQAGSHIILWYGLTWSLEQYLQLNARLHRHGQKKGVIVHHLIVKGTVDGRVFRALKAKFKTQSELLDYLKGVKW